jgi:hypothetical protein
MQEIRIPTEFAANKELAQMLKRSAKALALVALIGSWWLASAAPAQAYIDPGSTSFIIQIIVGSLLTIGLALATFWKRIRLLFSKRSPKKEQ